MSEPKSISCVDFTISFNTEEKCREQTFSIRWPNGFEYPKCKNHKYYPIKRGCSATVLTNKLNISYKTAWYLLKRIQTAMMEHDWDYMLSGTVEFDDVFFGATDDGGKRGRGTDKAQVII